MGSLELSMFKDSGADDTTLFVSDYPFNFHQVVPSPGISSDMTVIIANQQTPTMLVFDTINPSIGTTINYSDAMNPGPNQFSQLTVTRTGTQYNLLVYSYSETPANLIFEGFVDQTVTFDISILIDTPCLHEDTLIDTSSGPIKIKDLKVPNKLIDHNKNEVELLFNAKFSTKRQFIKIKKDTFASNIPTEDVFICKNHPIMVNGKEIQPLDYVDGNNISLIELDQYVHVYTPCTPRITFVMAQGIGVSTWDEEQFADKVEGHFYYEKQ